MSERNKTTLKKRPSFARLRNAVNDYLDSEERAEAAVGTSDNQPARKALGRAYSALIKEASQ